MELPLTADYIGTTTEDEAFLFPLLKTIVTRELYPEEIKKLTSWASEMNHHRFKMLTAPLMRFIMAETMNSFAPGLSNRLKKILDIIWNNKPEFKRYYHASTPIFFAKATPELTGIASDKLFAQFCKLAKAQSKIHQKGEYYAVTIMELTDRLYLSCIDKISGKPQTNVMAAFISSIRFFMLDKRNSHHMHKTTCSFIQDIMGNIPEEIRSEVSNTVDMILHGMQESDSERPPCIDA